MSKGTRVGLLILILILLLLVDQITKLWAYNSLTPGQSISLFGPIDLTLVFNRRNAIGLAPDYGEVTRWTLTAINIAAACGISYWVWRRDETPLMIIGLSFIAGGGVGNAIDRIWLGAVIDMFNASEAGFIWVFNLADVFIDVGIGLSLLSSALGSSAVASMQDASSRKHQPPSR